jgi:hypothetical protein
MLPDFWLRESQSKDVGQTSISAVKLRWAREWYARGLRSARGVVFETRIRSCYALGIAKVIHLPSLLYRDIVSFVYSVLDPHWSRRNREMRSRR